MIPIERVEKLDPARLLRRDAQAEADVSAAVDDVIETVRTRGDEALRDYTRRFDGAELTDLRVWNGYPSPYHTGGLFFSPFQPMRVMRKVD